MFAFNFISIANLSFIKRGGINGWNLFVIIKRF